MWERKLCFWLRASLAGAATCGHSSSAAFLQNGVCLGRSQDRAEACVDSGALPHAHFGVRPARRRIIGKDLAHRLRCRWDCWFDWDLRPFERGGGAVQGLEAVNTMSRGTGHNLYNRLNQRAREEAEFRRRDPSETEARAKRAKDAADRKKGRLDL